VAGLGPFFPQLTCSAPQGMLRVFRWGAPAALIVLGALSLEVGGHVRRVRLGVLLGDASYVIYLVHAFVVSAFLWFFSGAPIWSRVLVCVIASCLIAVVIHLLLERPLNRRLLDAYNRRRRRPVREESPT
jgi:exopolysaccharide production protein ExoZ